MIADLTILHVYDTHTCPHAGGGVVSITKILLRTRVTDRSYRVYIYNITIYCTIFIILYEFIYYMKQNNIVFPHNPKIVFYSFIIYAKQRGVTILYIAISFFYIVHRAYYNDLSTVRCRVYISNNITRLTFEEIRVASVQRLPIANADVPPRRILTNPIFANRFVPNNKNKQ